MRVSTIAVLSALSAVASALHAFSIDPNHPPADWRNFQSDDDFALNREGEAFFVHKSKHDSRELVDCFELHHRDSNQLVYATEHNQHSVHDFENDGFHKTGVDFPIFVHQHEHTVPLFRTATDEGQFLFTINFDEARNNHYRFQETVGFVFPRHFHRTMPIRRWILVPEH